MNVILRLPHALKSPQIARIVSQRLYCAASAGVKERIDQMVKKDNVVVFMKGDPDQPLCGFSNAVVQILRMHGVDKYASYNVLEDEELRQGIKEFSNWPTVPQLYMGGDFIGGCDILMQMHQEGELIEELKKVGIKSALLEKAAEGGQSEQEKKD